jgi:hypothetical protein
MASVPDDMSFPQQVRVVEGGLRKAEARASGEDKERMRLQACDQLKAERERIWSRYSNWQYQPAEVVGPDRTRWKTIEAEQRRLNCAQR